MPIIYPSSYYAYSDSDSQSKNRIVKFIRTKLEVPKIKTYVKLLGEGERLVFDIGCGDGRLFDIIKLVVSGEWHPLSKAHFLSQYIQFEPYVGSRIGDIVFMKHL